MKRILVVLLAVFFILNLTACSNRGNNTEVNLKDLFVEHLISELPTDASKIILEDLQLYGNTIDLELEEREYNYRIIVTMCDGYSPKDEQFFNVTLQDLKNKMNLFAEHFITFAKKLELDNDYYLYVYIETIDFNFVYDYEQNKLYYPERYDELLEMNTKFGTVNDDEVAKTTHGKQWLVENNFGVIKHHEYEKKYFYDDPFISIDSDGKFVAYFLEDFV